MIKGFAHTISEGADFQHQSLFNAASDGLIICDLATNLLIDANPAICRMTGFGRDSLIGQTPTILAHPDHQEAFSGNLQKLQLNDRLEIQLLQMRQDGSTFPAEWHLSVFFQNDRPCILGIIRDISERIQEETKLKLHMETHIREQAMLLHISHTLASTLELQPELILEHLGEIIEYNLAGLFTLSDSSLIPIAICGLPAQYNPALIRIPLSGTNAPPNLLTKHRPFLIADVWSNEPQAKLVRSILGKNAKILLKGMHSWMWIPMAVKNRIVGGLGIAHKKRDHFLPHHANLALSIANQAAITIINTELHQQAQELAIIEERQRLARNLHDAVNQSLFSASLIADVLPRLWERDQAQARNSLEDLRKLTRGAMAEMRALLVELRPSTLTDVELGELLSLLGNAFTGRTNIPVQLTICGEGVLPAGTQVAIYRISQEAMNNIAKHAKAGRVEILLKHEGAGIELMICDDGKGFDQNHASAGHYGLSMMQERSDAIGAQLNITSHPGQGTKLDIRWMPKKVTDIK